MPFLLTETGFKYVFLNLEIKSVSAYFYTSPPGYSFREKLPLRGMFFLQIPESLEMPTKWKKRQSQQLNTY